MTNDAMRRLKAGAIRGGRSRRKLKPEQVRDIYARAHAGENQDELAAEYGIAQSGVSRIKRGLTWWWITGGLRG
jgi:hypothetical protein